MYSFGIKSFRIWIPQKAFCFRFSFAWLRCFASSGSSCFAFRKLYFREVSANFMLSLCLTNPNLGPLCFYTLILVLGPKCTLFFFVNLLLFCLCLEGMLLLFCMLGTLFFLEGFSRVGRLNILLSFLL